LLDVSKKSPQQEQRALRRLLRQLRRDAKVTQQALANQLGRPQSYVSKYEAGERRLDVLELREVCRNLGTSLEEFSRKLESLLSD